MSIAPKQTRPEADVNLPPPIRYLTIKNVDEKGNCCNPQVLLNTITKVWQQKGKCVVILPNHAFIDSVGKEKSVCTEWTEHDRGSFQISSVPPS